MAMTNCETPGCADPTHPQANKPVLGVLTGRYPSRTMPIAMDAKRPGGVTGQHFRDRTEDNRGEQGPAA